MLIQWDNESAGRVRLMGTDKEIDHDFAGERAMVQQAVRGILRVVNVVTLTRLVGRYGPPFSGLFTRYARYETANVTSITRTAQQVAEDDDTARIRAARAAEDAEE